MSAQDITAAVMELPEQERLDLARRIIVNISAEREAAQKISHAVPGIEDIITGRLAGLNEAEFRNALK